MCTIPIGTTPSPCVSCDPCFFTWKESIIEENFLLESATSFVYSEELSLETGSSINSTIEINDNRLHQQ